MPESGEEPPSSDDDDECEPHSWSQLSWTLEILVLVGLRVQANKVVCDSGADTLLVGIWGRHCASEHDACSVTMEGETA